MSLREAGATLSNVDLLAFGAGPGSFTGVRIAASVAQGLALGVERPVIAISTLEGIAEQAQRVAASERVIACTDARMGEVYAACYERVGDRWREVMSPAVVKPAMLHAPPGEGWVGCGNAFAAYAELQARLGVARVMPEIHATGGAIAAIASTRTISRDAADPACALPLYVRHRVALTTAEREAGLRL